VILSVLAYQMGHNFVDGHWWPNRAFTNPHARPKMVDDPLTLIFIIGLGMCCFVFGLWRLRILSECNKIAKSLINYVTYKMKSHWRCIDAEFLNRGGCVSVSLLPMTAAIIFFVHLCDQSPCRVTVMRNQTLFILHGRSVCHWHIRNMEPLNLA
jgi:hypothetical protein